MTEPFDDALVEAVSDEMIDAALAVWFKANREALGEPFGEDHRNDMRATLAAALAVAVPAIEVRMRTVDDAMVDRACRAHYNIHPADEPSDPERAHMRDALTAAIRQCQDGGEG